MSENNGGLQLLPETRKKINIYTPGQNRSLLFALASLALVAAIFGGLFFYNRSVLGKIAEADGKLKEIEDARDKVQEQKLLKLKDDLAVMGPILDEHVAWSAAFIRIQNLIIPQIQFDSLSVDLNKREYFFKAFAPGYEVVAKQISAFYSDKNITDVSVGKITTISGGRVEFDVTLVLDLDKVIKSNPSSPSQ